MEVTVQPTAPIIDVESLLAPIPGQSPAGISLRYETIYDELKKARHSDEELPQGEWGSKTKSADWKLVAELASKALATMSKDLQLAAWLTEALLVLHGFAGLRDGLLLTKGLHDRYWEVCFPPVGDGGDLDTRSAPLKWLNTKVPITVLAAQMTGRRGGDNYSWLDWQESRAIKDAQDKGKLSSELFDKAATATSRAFYEQLWTDVTAAQIAAKDLDQIIDERFGSQAPSLNELKRAIEDCVGLAETLLEKKRSQEPNPVANGQGVAKMEHGNGEVLSPKSVSFEGMPTSRGEALQRLAIVANYFKQTEPHSPVSYLVQRAVKWGDMKLEEWLKDVINSDDELMRVKETLGLKVERK